MVRQHHEMNSIPNTELQQGSARSFTCPPLVAAIGGLLFGFDTAVINGAIVFIKQQFGLSDSQTEIAASSLLLGCVVGASMAAFTSDRFGRKRVLLAAASFIHIVVDRCGLASESDGVCRLRAFWAALPSELPQRFRHSTSQKSLRQKNAACSSP